VPTFCRHNHLVQNCPICSREQAIDLRPIVSSSAPRTTQPRPATPRPGRTRGGGSASRPGVVVRRVARGADDGFRSSLAIGLRSSEEAGRLAQELAFADYRCARLEEDPPGLYREVRGPAAPDGGALVAGSAAPDGGALGSDGSVELEERSWLAFLIAYLSPLEGDTPFSEIERVRTSWASGEMPDLDGVQTGPRSAHDPARGTRTLEAYRAWASRAGSQAAAFTGDFGWTPERRFARAYERLALPGLQRDARFDLLVTLGRLGVYDLQAASLALGGENDVTVGAKRAFGIGDPLLLERRAADLAQACSLPLEALDLGLYNWQRGERATLGLGAEPDPELEGLPSIQAALEL